MVARTAFPVVNATRYPSVCLSVIRVFGLLALGVAAAFANPAFASPRTDDLIRQVQDRYNGARTLTLGFRESYSLEGHARPPEEGTLTLRKQGKMRWDYVRPAGKLFVSDGKSIYLYSARDNKVEKVPLKDTEDMRAPLAFLLGHLDMKKTFGNFAVREGEGGTWLEAAAKNERTPYERVEMLIRVDGSIAQLRVHGRDQSVLDFSFLNERINVTAPNSLFQFTIPPGAEVVDSISYGGER
jgi:outer membrane lipoprotein carrier protein